MNTAFEIHCKLGSRTAKAARRKNSENMQKLKHLTLNVKVI